MASSEEVKQLRELITPQASQLEAVAKELTSQRSAVAQDEARSSLSLVDTKPLTKPNVYSGELDGKELWTTRSFKMRAYCAVMAPRMSELMGSASKRDQEIRQDAMTPKRRCTRHKPVLHVESADRWRSAGLCAKQSGGQWNGSLASNGDALGTKSAFQLSWTAASHLVSKVGHTWLGRDTVVDSVGKAGAGLRAAEWRHHL